MPVSLSYGNVNEWGVRSAPTVLRQSFGATVGGAGAYLPVSRPDRTGLHWGAGGGTLRPSAPRTTGFRTGNDAPAAGDIAAIAAWWRSKGPGAGEMASGEARPYAGDATAPSAPHNGAWQAMAVKVAKGERWSFIRADRCPECLAEWEARENKAKEAWSRFENGEGATAVSFQMWEDPHTGERSFTRIREALPSGVCGNPTHTRVKGEAPESAPITVQEWETTLSQNPETGAFEFKRGPARCRTRHTGGRIAPTVADYARAPHGMPEAMRWHGPLRAPVERPVVDDAPDNRVRRTALESAPRVVDGDAPVRAYMELRHETAEKLAAKVCRECKRATCRAVLRGTVCPYANGRKQPSQAKPSAPVAPSPAPSAAPRYRIVG